MAVVAPKSSAVGTLDVPAGEPNMVRTAIFIQRHDQSVRIIARKQNASAIHPPPFGVESDNGDVDIRRMRTLLRGQPRVGSDRTVFITRAKINHTFEMGFTHGVQQPGFQRRFSAGARGLDARQRHKSRGKFLLHISWRKSFAPKPAATPSPI